MSDPRLVPDRRRPGAWFVRVGGADQSFVDPSDPTWLEFDYVRRIADVIDQLAAPAERLRVVHVGGAGLTLPRYVAATRPASRQIVFEPDSDLTAAVRRVAPLPRRSGITVRALDGRRGVAALADGRGDLVVVDAFEGARVPAELATVEWFGELARVLAADGAVVMNLTDHSPFPWSRRVVAAVAAIWQPRRAALTLAAEPSTLKGRRFGNLVVAAGARLDPAALESAAARGPFPYRLLANAELVAWLGGARPFTDADGECSPLPPGGPTTFR